MFIALTFTEKCGLKLFLQNIFTKLRNMHTRNAQKISTPFRKYIEFRKFLRLSIDPTSIRWKKNQPPNSSLTLDPPARKHVNFYQSFWTLFPRAVSMRVPNEGWWVRIQISSIPKGFNNSNACFGSLKNQDLELPNKYHGDIHGGIHGDIPVMHDIFHDYVPMIFLFFGCFPSHGDTVTHSQALVSSRS